MSKIMVLDCTLRDGGYVNNNNFGENNIKRLIKYLNDANVDIIECGYIYDNLNYDINKTEYLSGRQVESFITKDNNYTLMLSGIKYKIENLPEKDSGRVDIIRLPFHKKDIDEVIEYSKKIIEKGYKLYLQPQVIMTYTDEEIIKMIKEINELDVECVSIVDTFGQMTPKDVKEKTLLFDKYLRKNIKIGLHLHNNLQTAFANAMIFLDIIPENRDVVIDTSLLGMGRGAGNLPTELLANYLNNRYQKKYNIEAMLEACDNIISKIKEEHEWGYSLPYYLSATNGIHPSYIILFLERKTLNSVDINNLIKMIPEEKKTLFDREYAEELYRIYNDKKVNDEDARKKLKKLVSNKRVVLIGPGKSTLNYHDKIENILSQENTVSIAINGNDLFYTDATFYSNKKRYSEQYKKDNLTLLTSNIKTESEEDELIFDYNKSLSRIHHTSDNALLIVLNILKDMGIEEIVLVGFDGFSKDAHNNFYSYDKMYALTEGFMQELNELITSNIEKYSDKMKIKSLTPTIYIGGKNENSSSGSNEIK